MKNVSEFDFFLKKKKLTRNLIPAGINISDSFNEVIQSINNKIKKFDLKIIIEKYEPLKMEFCLFIKTAETLNDK